MVQIAHLHHLFIELHRMLAVLHFFKVRVVKFSERRRRWSMMTTHVVFVHEIHVEFLDLKVLQVAVMVIIVPVVLARFSEFHVIFAMVSEVHVRGFSWSNEFPSRYAHAKNSNQL